MPQYLYLVAVYLHGPTQNVAYTAITPMFAAGSLVSVALLVTAPIRIITGLRERSAHSAAGNGRESR